MYRKCYFLLGFAFLLYSCNQPIKSSKISVTINDSKMDITELKAQMMTGDTSAYNMLKIRYLDFTSEYFLFYSLVMANKYNYPRAYLDVFYTLINSYVGDISNFNSLDKKTKNMALEYLNYAVEANVEGSKKILNKISKIQKNSLSN